MQEFLGEIVGREEVQSPLKTPEGKASFLTTLAIRKEFSFDPGGRGALGMELECVNKIRRLERDL